jgi:hypothetical protein
MRCHFTVSVTDDTEHVTIPAMVAFWLLVDSVSGTGRMRQRARTSAEVAAALCPFIRSPLTPAWWRPLRLAPGTTR